MRLPAIDSPVKVALVVLALVLSGVLAMFIPTSSGQQQITETATIKADIARITALDMRQWATELVGKPADVYLPALGLTPYEKVPLFGQIGQRVVTDKTEKNIWMVETGKGTIIIKIDGPYAKVE